MDAGAGTAAAGADETERENTGWVYATFPLASIFSPFVSGYLADKYVNAEWVIMASHVIGAVLLFVAAKQTKFWGMFWTMLVYSVFYIATIPLVTKVLYAHPSVSKLDACVWLWAPVSWGDRLLDGHASFGKSAATGLTACTWPRFSPSQVAGLPDSAADAASGRRGDDGGRSRQSHDEGVWHAGEPQLSDLHACPVGCFRHDAVLFSGHRPVHAEPGIRGKNVSAAMGMAQAVQAAATILLLVWLIDKGGYAWTFAIGPCVGPFCSQPTSSRKAVLGSC